MRQSAKISRSVSLVALLKACTKQKDLHKGSLIHASIVRKGSVQMDVFVGSALVNMYAKCGALIQAQEVFDMLPARNLISWNALITGYAQHGCGKEAISCFEQMQNNGLSPDAVTLAGIFKACGTIGAAAKGQEIHSQFTDIELLHNDTVMGTALIDMYAKCGLLGRAQEVFDGLVDRNIVSWTALIGGYVQHGHHEEALVCFERMEKVGLSPNAVTFICMLKACRSIGALDKGQDIHVEISRLGLLGEECVSTALVDMYSKCGLLEKAREVFEAISLQSIDSWNALIAGYVQNGVGKEALSCFKQMKHKGFPPDAITFLCILKACGNIGAGLIGQEVHSQIVGDGFIEQKTAVSTALMDMYAKCGSPERAQAVFGKLQQRDVSSWNAAISGYAQSGENDMVFKWFEKMIEEGKEPDLATSTIILNACSHKGLVDEGQIYFEVMGMLYGITPTLEHHACMIDLLSRVGCVDKAVAVIKDMPFQANVTVWHTLLGACQKGKDPRLGRVAFEHALQLDEDDSGAYVCIRNMYVDDDR